MEKLKNSIPSRNFVDNIVSWLIISEHIIRGEIIMEFSFSLKIKAAKEDAWEYYANIEKWYDWEEDLKNIPLKGKF